MARTAAGPESIFPELPVKAYFCCGANPPVAPLGKLSCFFASRSAKVPCLELAGSVAHFLCSDIFSFTGSLLEHLCPVVPDSRGSILHPYVGSDRGRGWVEGALGGVSGKLKGA